MSNTSATESAGLESTPYGYNLNVKQFLRLASACPTIFLNYFLWLHSRHYNYLFAIFIFTLGFSGDTETTFFIFSRHLLQSQVSSGDKPLNHCILLLLFWTVAEGRLPLTVKFCTLQATEPHIAQKM